MVKLEENLSFPRYSLGRSLDNTELALAFLKDLVIFRAKMRMFQDFQNYLSKGLLAVVDIFYKQPYELCIYVIPMPVSMS